jgi:Cu-Zn family superoxide dismutase
VSAALLGIVLAISGCASSSSSAPQPLGAVAVADLKPTQGNSVAGTVSFRQQGDRLLVVARVHGLKPNREHGFHVHEKGDCSSGDATSAGAHMNPDGHPHGPQSGSHHAGDMPALKADASGTAVSRFELKGELQGAGASAYLGKAIIVHADPDDYVTQPTGNSGARVACGVIQPRTGATADE